MIEFYGEISEYTKRRAEKLKKRYFAKWIGVLALISGAVAALSGATRSGFIVPLVCAVLLLGVAFLLYFMPMRKKDSKTSWKFRVTIEGSDLTFVQYLPGKTLEKTRKVGAVKRIIKTDFCYFVVFNDISNAVICERCLLKKGTFEQFEIIFSDKIREKKYKFY